MHINNIDGIDSVVMWNT